MHQCKDRCHMMHLSYLQCFCLRQVADGTGYCSISQIARHCPETVRKGSEGFIGIKFVYSHGVTIYFKQ